jgi:predicted cytidylate kinase
MRLSISGPIGSGKTTVCELLAKKLGYRMVVSGHIFRQMAKERGMSLADFGALAERDPSIDRELDQRMVDIAKAEDDIIIEGRLAAYNLDRAGVDAFKVLLDADVEIRAARVAKRETEDLKKAAVEMLERARSEALRYKKYYDIDINDDSVYDMVVDTSDLTPERVVDLIVTELQEGKPCPCS